MNQWQIHSSYILFALVYQSVDLRNYYLAENNKTQVKIIPYLQTSCTSSWQPQQASWLPARRIFFHHSLQADNSCTPSHTHTGCRTSSHSHCCPLKPSVYSVLFLITASLNSRCNFPLCIHLNTNTDTQKDTHTHSHTHTVRYTQRYNYPSIRDNNMTTS